MRVLNDIASTFGKRNGNLLVLLDLSAAFGTIDHVILFAILKKYIGFEGNALKLIMSYFSDHTQRVVATDIHVRPLSSTNFLRITLFLLFFKIQTEALLECTLSRYTLHILTQALITHQNLYIETHNGTYLLLYM